MTEQTDQTPESPDDFVIEVDNLQTGYGSKMIIEDVSFKVPRGEIVCLIGGSGSGKSTIFRTLVGLVSPWKGTVKLFGHETAQMDHDDRAPLLRRVGMLFQNGALLSSMSVGDNVGLPLRQHTDLPPGIIRRIVAQKLAMFGLEQHADKSPSELSGGMRKRVALSRAIVMNPELLLCDEPSAGLDPIVAAGLDDILRDLQAKLNMTIVVVTHELASIELIADRVVMLQPGGTLIAQGPLQEVKQRDDSRIREFFARTPPVTAPMERSLLDALEGTN